MACIDNMFLVINQMKFGVFELANLLIFVKNKTALKSIF